MLISLRDVIRNEDEGGRRFTSTLSARRIVQVTLSLDEELYQLCIVEVAYTPPGENGIVSILPFVVLH